MTDRLSENEVAALATAFHRASQAAQLLERAGIDRSRQPSWTGQSSLEFWQEIDNLLSLGILVDGRRRILDVASRAYPANRIFAAAAGLAVARDGGTSADNGRRASSRPPAGTRPQPGPGLFLAVDPVRISPAGSLAPVDWQAGLREILERATERCGLPPGALRSQERGAGLLSVIHGGVSPAVVVADLVRELVRMMTAHNGARAAADRIRLRLGLYLDSATIDEAAGADFGRSAAVAAVRLADAPAVGRLLLESRAADVAVIVSSSLFESTVRPGLRGLDPAEFHPVDVHIPSGGHDQTAWVGLPGSRTAFDDTPSLTPDLPEAASGIRSWDFIVSVASEDDGWGQWLAWELESNGHYVHLQAWVVAGEHWVHQLDTAIRNSRRMVIVLTENYLRAPRVQAEWATVWDTDRAGVNRRLIPVRVEECRPEGLLRGIAYIDLVGLDDDAAKATLRRGLEASLSGRFRPDTPPPFPGPRRRS
ncbi:toll/interleukin-1 receptor domain-containing protein [Frankia sp. AgB32]|uniref:toll/interleukin-1 receptor domain-containing protein n=1 Tax=Frankia sp. AgB32 TaxID=631119 RepID=UPI00200CFF09|nr:toll/interleukin-1 receptor domain-containing protein [Frankia sp. AgB32]MCK9897238.1 toll/interleukin-1 receptor domain-containing protein [Frankia sp. AgB32]